MNDRPGPGLTISCDDCCMRCTAACDDCVVSFLLDEHDDSERPAAAGEAMVLDVDQARVVHLLGRAGLVPELRYRIAG